MISSTDRCFGDGRPAPRFLLGVEEEDSLGQVQSLREVCSRLGEGGKLFLESLPQAPVNIKGFTCSSWIIAPYAL